MALGLILRLACTKPLRIGGVRRYANVFPVTLVGKPPPPPKQGPSPPLAAPSALDSLILSQLRSSAAPGLPALIHEYEKNEGHVLDQSLSYESRPTTDQKLIFDRQQASPNNRVVMVAHAFRHQDQHKVAICSGFALNAPSSQGDEASGDQGDTIIVTCAHTLEEMRNSPLLSAESSPADKPGPVSDPDVPHSGTFVLSNASDGHSPVFHPVTSVLSSLHRADLMVLSVPRTSPSPHALRPLPVSPYPVHPGTAVRAHFVVDKEPDEAGWHPWVGGTWSKWVKGTVLGYRDFAGREAKPGTYDALSHLLFRPLPTPGSSGGPIVDEETGAVVGVVVGTRMDSEIDGLRGWGRPAETIFEMFTLPGLNLKKK